MITDQKEAMNYLIKHKKGNVIELTNTIINPETVKTLQVLGDLFVNCFNNEYQLTKQGIKSHKYIYSNKTSLGDKLRGLFCHYVLRY